MRLSIILKFDTTLMYSHHVQTYKFVGNLLNKNKCSWENPAKTLYVLTASNKRFIFDYIRYLGMAYIQDENYLATNVYYCNTFNCTIFYSLIFQELSNWSRLYRQNIGFRNVSSRLFIWLLQGLRKL